MNHDIHLMASIALGCGLVEVASVLIIHDKHHQISWAGIGLAIVCVAVAVYLWIRLWRARRK